MSKVVITHAIRIDEAFAVAQRLRDQSAIKLSGTQKDKQAQYLALRNGLVSLLNTPLHKARRAARYVFRNHPDVVVA